MVLTIVNTMAGITLASEQKKLHPFFTAPKSLQSDAPSVPTTTPTTATTATPDAPKADEEQVKMDDTDEPVVEGPRRKKRKSNEGADENFDETKKPKRGRPRKVVAPGPSILNHFSKTDDGSKDVSTPEQSSGPATAVLQVQPQASVLGDKNETHGQNDHTSERKSPLKKMLQFNPKTGTIGSPPKPKETQPSKKQTKAEDGGEDTITPPSSKGKRRSTRIATTNYGSDNASRIRIGAKIDSILDDTIDPGPTPKTRTRTRTRISRQNQHTIQDTPEVQPEPGEDLGATKVPVKKGTHPFFTGNPKQTASVTTEASSATSHEAVRIKPPAPSRPRIFSSTPMSPRKPRPVAPSAPPPQWGVKSLGLKTPGAQHPAWPAKDMVHIRGGNSDTIPDSSSPTPEQMAARKSKGRRIHIATMENLLNNFASNLHISEAVESVKNIDTESFLPPPSELRLPQKRLESGVKLKEWVLQELKNSRHPALAQLCQALPTSLSAFDRNTCEPVSWAQKYTPTSAVEVLQYGKEAPLLRNWLEAMKVLSVDTGDAKIKPAKPPRKKRKKNKDDFVVESEEEADDMDEVSDLDEDWLPDRCGLKKTVIRVGDNAARDSKHPGRLTNTVVISGPHGCGKTSAVYAIAKELDFEVFEINSGSRRSGKDILEKIGDMTRNHLVQHHQTETSAAAIDEEEVAQDIKSGKQATMNSFFKPKAAAQPAKSKPNKKEALAPMKTESKKAPPKNQKQSLILLDEVDILYEEDKQFWSTVISLISQSKRPFIMTCNDENLLPLQTLSLHGIFRFSTPPPDLAADRLLLIAACEGHALRRNAVEALFDARQHDLRACLMDLNYWCQIAVGDNRGGIDWLLPRWPKGCDIDADGNIIRVISQDTYVEGIGWLGHDVVCEGTDHGNLEEELVQEVNDFWNLDLANWHDSLDLPSYAATLETSTGQDRLSVLKSYEEFTDTLSLADLSSTMTSAAHLLEPIDCTYPDMTAKARDDYISGRQVLDAPLKSTYDPLTTSLPASLKCLARKTLQASLPGDSSSTLDTLNENDIISKIRHRAVTPTVTTLSRDDFSKAFDVLAVSEKEANSLSSYLDPSVFDGTMANIVVDVAPYVRGIVAFEKELQKQRQKLSSLLSQGGKKRNRNTRAAQAALEGGSRSTVRRDKWFEANLNGVLVMRTAGEGWMAAARDNAGGSIDISASPGDSAPRKAKARRIVTDGSDEDSGSESDMDMGMG